MSRFLRLPALDPPVNKQDLSTGENGEFGADSTAAGRSPAVRSCAPLLRAESRRTATCTECWG